MIDLDRLNGIIELLKAFANTLPSADKTKFLKSLTQLEKNKSKLVGALSAATQDVNKQLTRISAEWSDIDSAVSTVSDTLSSEDMTTWKNLRGPLDQSSEKTLIANVLSNFGLYTALSELLKTLETLRMSVGNADANEDKIVPRILDLAKEAEQLDEDEKRVFTEVRLLKARNFLGIIAQDPALNSTQKAKLKAAKSRLQSEIQAPYSESLERLRSDKFLAVSIELNKVTEKAKKELKDLEALVKSLEIIGGILGVVSRLVTLLV